MECPEERPRVRRLEPDDAATVLDLVGRLAEFERLADSCVAHHDAIHQALSGERPRLEGFLAEEGGRPLGLATFSLMFSTFAGRPRLFIEDLFVVEECRGAGIGRLLFEEIVDQARRLGCVQVTWQVLSWNTAAIEFYRRQGGTRVSGWETFSRVV